MRLLFTLAALPACLLLYPWALALVPFYPYALIGFGLPHERAWMGTTLAVEIVLGLGFLGRWLVLPKDGLSLLLLFIPITALPSLLNAGNPVFSAMLTWTLMLGVGFYGYWRDHMPEQLSRRVPQLAFAVWLGLAFAIKFYESAILHSPWWAQRSGGIWAANHAAGILILLLPFVTTRWAIVPTILFVLTSNSRGVYATAFLIAVGYAAIGHWRAVLKGFVLTIAGVALVFFQLDPQLRAPVVAFVTQRFFVSGGTLDEGTRRVFAERLQSDERWQIHDAAGQLASLTDYQGVGIGGFQFALPKLGRAPEYSNAHNVFLTAWSEGGMLFTSCLVIILVYAFGLAVQHDMRMAIGLAAWSFYGLFNGELWEAAGMGTTGDYLTLLFVLAYLSWVRAAGRVGASTPVSEPVFA